MKIAYNYIEEHKLLLIKWTGQWNLEEYIKYVNSFIKNSGTIDVQKIIHDITDLDFDIKFIEITKLVKIRKEIFKQDYKVVYIINKPKDVIFSHLYSKELQNKNTCMYCTTIEKALDLLLIIIPDFELKNRLSMLEKELLNSKFNNKK